MTTPTLRALHTLTGALAAAALLTGCTPTPTTHESADAKASASAVPTTSATPTGAGAGAGAGAGHVPASAPPTTSPASTGDVAPQEESESDADWSAPIDQTQTVATTTLASKFVAAYIRKDRTGTAWSDGYLALLNEQGKAAYGVVDQTRVPGTTVTGPATAQPVSANSGAIINVPTDAGVWEVHMLRDPGTGWYVLRAVPPQNGTGS